MRAATHAAVREFATFFAIQTVSYALITYNFRSLAATRMMETLASDALNSSFAFFIIRKIAKSDDSYSGFAGYVTGSLLGTYLGMRLT